MALSSCMAVPAAAQVSDAPVDRASPHAAIRTLVEENLAQVGEEHRAAFRGLTVVEAPLSAEDVTRAERSRARARGAALPTTAMTCSSGVPLVVLFADYTLDASGTAIPGETGWTPTERERFRSFLCSMLPLMAEIYGDPFSPWEITLVKDLFYSSSWIFIPSALEIHGSGSWNPRLVTHEFLHAFRGQRTLTSDSSWRYDPTLSGFEEGFAEGIAYVAMNEFVRRFCTHGNCSAYPVPSWTIWGSYLEGSYDYSNDRSMTTTDFWSESGGTLKPNERYVMAAAAIMRLQEAIPSFSRRFNSAYYSRIRSDPGYRPSRAGVVAIIEELSAHVGGTPTRRWLASQRIFDCRASQGKGEWTENYAPYSSVGQNRRLHLHPVETFPNGAQWAYYVTDCPSLRVPGQIGDWLYNRMHDIRMQLALTPSWQGGTPLSAVVVPYADTGGYRVLGCNDVPGGFAFGELTVVPSSDGCRGRAPTSAACWQPVEFGLYRISSRWNNPQFEAAPGPPLYGMPYDQSQGAIEDGYYQLAGPPPPDFDPSEHLILAGVLGAMEGTVEITHSRRPDATITAPLSNGALYAAPPVCRSWPPTGDCWVVPYAEWSASLVTLPGTLRFEFSRVAGGPTVLIGERTIVHGERGRHEFLLDVRGEGFLFSADGPARGGPWQRGARRRAREDRADTLPAER